MGFSVTWYTVPEKDGDQFAQKLALSPTGETEEIPESLDCMGKLDTGWRLFWHLLRLALLFGLLPSHGAGELEA